jgi:4-amino-4-deoxy-L-arabinose transferase-like glycosyltransferase
MLNAAKISRLPKNPYLLFSPFLLLYVALAVIFPTLGNTGDEEKYLALAHNLIHGYYSTPAPDVYLAEGPGYSIVLLPFVATGLPLICIALLNAVFYYLSVILLFKSLKQLVTYRAALIVSLVWACYYNAYETIPLVLTETFATFLVSLILYYLIKAFAQGDHQKTKKYVYLAGFFIGYLALTKIIFGYVLLFMLAGCGILWIINRQTANYKRALIMLAIALATTAPYLIYTYHLTGRIFYWGTSGGNNLYWMSSPAKGEYGDWFSDLKGEKDSIPGISDSPRSSDGIQLISQKGYNYFSGTSDSLKYHHQKDFDEINKYTGVQRDDAFKKLAIRNMKSHPVKFVQNCISNAGRIFFNYPYSYTLQKPGTLVRLPLNGLITMFSLFCLVLTFINWRRIIFPIRLALFIALLYLGGSILGSAETRMFTIIVPVLLAWIAYVIQRSVKINLKMDEHIEPS